MCVKARRPMDPDNAPSRALPTHFAKSLRQRAASHCDDKSWQRHTVKPNANPSKNLPSIPTLLPGPQSGLGDVLPTNLSEFLFCPSHPWIYHRCPVTRFTPFLQLPGSSNPGGTQIPMNTLPTLQALVDSYPPSVAPPHCFRASSNDAPSPPRVKSWLYCRASGVVQPSYEQFSSRLGVIFRRPMCS